MREFSDAFAIDLTMICEDFRNEPTPCDSNGGMPQYHALVLPLYFGTCSSFISAVGPKKSPTN
jgi:hypothetical protein